MDMRMAVKAYKMIWDEDCNKVRQANERDEYSLGNADKLIKNIVSVPVNFVANDDNQKDISTGIKMLNFYRGKTNGVIKFDSRWTKSNGLGAEGVYYEVYNLTDKHLKEAFEKIVEQ